MPALVLIASLAAGPLLDVNCQGIPDSCLADFSPTPSHCGRVFVGTDGRLYFQNGQRAIFWGVSIAKGSVFQPKERIDEAVRAIARAGFNLVRFHHLDDEDGLLPRSRAGRPDRIDPNKLAALDYWIYQLGKRGLYVYLDLLAYRTFWPEEGVPEGDRLGRGAKPYALFDRQLIKLQQRYARQLLLQHKNRYTGRSYAEDPAVLFVELCDENGLFAAWRRGQKLADEYRKQLLHRFNAWLQERYGNDAELREAWTDAEGNCCLRAGESLKKGTVKLADGPGSSGRHTDTALFYEALHAKYFAKMREALEPARQAGILIGAMTDPLVPADLRCSARNLDFVACNWYWDHPAFREGRSWELPWIYHLSNPLRVEGRVDDFASAVAAARVSGKPLVVREWAPAWPNPYRAAAMLQAAVYGSLQDIDAMILFALDIRPEARSIQPFNVLRDPARWGLAALCGQIFRRRLLGRFDDLAVIGFSPADVLLEPLRPIPQPEHKLAYLCRVANAFFERKLDARATLTIASGRSRQGRYELRNLVLASNVPWADPYRHLRSDGLDAENGLHLASVPGGRLEFLFGGTIFDPGIRKRVPVASAYLTADVRAKGFRPIGLTPDRKLCLGARDPRRNLYLFKVLPAQWRLRLAVDALGHVLGRQLMHRMLDEGVWTALGGKVALDVRRGVLAVNGEAIKAFAGAFGGPAAAGSLEIEGLDRGCCIWLSLDGRPVEQSRRWVLKLVRDAANTNQKLVRRGGRALLTQGGQPPVVGLAPPRPVTVRLPGGAVGIEGAAAVELMADGGRVLMWADRPGARVTLRLGALGEQFAVHCAGAQVEHSGSTITMPGPHYVVILEQKRTQ